MSIDFQGTKVFLDTAPFIHYFKGSTATAAVDRLFLQKDSAQIGFLTSTVTLSEILLQPFRQGAVQLAARYHLMLTYSHGLKIHRIDQPIAERAAQLRASYQLNSTSALQLATAIIHGADFFLTHDQHLKRIKEMTVITLDDLP